MIRGADEIGGPMNAKMRPSTTVVDRVYDALAYYGPLTVASLVRRTKSREEAVTAALDDDERFLKCGDGRYRIRIGC